MVCSNESRSARSAATGSVRGVAVGKARIDSRTAAILRHATPTSFVVVDEIGRGTSTVDGTAVAYAVAKTLADEAGGPLTIFTTHFHELTALQGEAGVSLANAHVSADVDAAGKALTLLYEVKPGPSRASFGIACAEIAGFPPAVVADAARRAAALERRAPSS